MKWVGRMIEWSRKRENILTLVVTVALFVAALALYVRTMAPGLLDGDEGEFQINIFRLGVSHTGYPTFFLLGKLFTLLVPVGTIATRANLFSAFWGALAVVAVFVFMQFLTRNRWAALFTALLFTASRVEWSQAIIPRPYTLNSLFVVLVPLFFFLWRVGKVNLTVPVFVFGLSLTNHRTMMWFAPAIALFVLLADYQAVFGSFQLQGNVWVTLRRWFAQSELLQPRQVLALAAAFIAPLLLYGYVFWRGESDVGVEFHWKDFNDEIMGGYVRASWRFGPFDWLISRVTDLYLPMQIEQFTAIGFVAGLIGMLALALDRVPRGWDRKLPPREVLLFIVLANVFSTAFCVIFWVIDIDKFFLQSFISLLFFTGIGVAVVWDWFANRAVRWVTQGVMALAFVGAIGFLVQSNYAGNDFSARTDTILTWQDNLAQPLEPHALIVGNWESLTPLEYAMYVDGKRTDLERWKVLIKNYQLGQVLYGSRQADIEREVRAGRPVYLTFYPGDTETLGALVNEFRLVSVGGLWRIINLPPQATVPPSNPLVRFADSAGRTLELVGVSQYPQSGLRAGDFGLATLFWRVPQSVSAHYTISFRVLNAQNQVVYQRDAEPANNLRPTQGWAPNEIVQDDIGFFIPPNSVPGIYQLAVVVYNPANGEELQANGKALYVVGQVNDLP